MICEKVAPNSCRSGASSFPNEIWERGRRQEEIESYDCRKEMFWHFGWYWCRSRQSGLTSPGARRNRLPHRDPPGNATIFRGVESWTTGSILFVSDDVSTVDFSLFHREGCPSGLWMQS